MMGRFQNMTAALKSEPVATPTTQTAEATPFEVKLPIQPSQMAWTMGDDHMAHQLQVIRIEAVWTARPSVCGSMAPYTERVEYVLKGGVRRSPNQIFATKQELLDSL